MKTDNEKRWYLVHTYAGYENKVKDYIRHRIEVMNMQDEVYDILIPTQDVVKSKKGEKVVSKKRIFPGYILVQMKLSEESWHVIRNTPGVTGFIGLGNEPTPLPEKDVREIMGKMGEGKEKITYETEFKEGQSIKIIDGPFLDFHATIKDVNPVKQKVKAMVNIFGRETAVELDFMQIESL